MKRNSTSPIPIAKRTRKNTHTASWISASSTFNYGSKDQLVDWLSRKERMFSLPKRTSSNNKNFVSFIKEKGNEFETMIINLIKEKFDVYYGGNSINDETCKRVKDLMADRVEIIYSAPFQDETTKTQGIIDMLVRSDILQQLTTIAPPQVKSSISYYTVIDIKFSTIPLRADNLTILNQNHYPAYKHQLCIYNNALLSLQNYIPRYAYILGRRCSRTTKKATISTHTPFEKLGVIDYKDADKEFITSTDNSINWLRRVEKEGKDWVAYPVPSVKELYPNMCVNSGHWNQEKERIAQNIGEITTIWMCGVTARNNANMKGVFSWKDPRCTSEVLGFKNKHAEIVDAILDINRKEFPISRTFSCQHLLKKNRCEMFVDFETFIDTDIQGNKMGESPIFMIGVGLIKNNKPSFYTFTSKTNTPSDEKLIIEEFYSLVQTHKPAKIWHWHADEIIWNKRTFNLKYDALPWTDLAKIFREEPIVVKGAFGFGLKEISKAMNNNNLINIFIDSNCKNGLMAGIEAQKEYALSKSPSTSVVIKDIEKYNMYDVKVLYEILKYLRSMRKH